MPFQITEWLARRPALRSFLRYALRRRIAILMYHGVVPSPLGVYHWCHLTLSEFRAQMMFLKAHYRVLALSEVVERLRQKQPIPERVACITFDDGFRTVSDIAFPVLRELELPFTLFVVPGHLDNGELPWSEKLFSAILHTANTTLSWKGREWNLSTPSQRSQCYRELYGTLLSCSTDERTAILDELLHALGQRDREPDPLLRTLTWDECRRLTASGLCELGVHSLTHAVLTRCSPDELEREVIEARNRLQNEKGVVPLFAYPHGLWDAHVQRVVKSAGFSGAVTTEHRLAARSENPFQLPRIGVGAGLTLEQFAAKLLVFWRVTNDTVSVPSSRSTSLKL